MNPFGPELPWVIISIGSALVGLGIILGVIEKIINRSKKNK